MQVETKTLGRRKRNIAIIAIVLIFTFGLLYFQIWKKPILIDSGIVKHHLTFSGHSNVVRQVVFSPDGELLASGSVDNTVMHIILMMYSRWHLVLTELGWQVPVRIKLFVYGIYHKVDEPLRAFIRGVRRRT